MMNAWKHAGRIGSVAWLASTALAGCGGSGTLSSSTSGAEASISATSIDFGRAPCGGEAPTEQTFTLKNGGSGPMRWSVSISSNAYFDLEGARSGELGEGESTTITVTAQSMPSMTAAGAVQQASILVTTDDPGAAEVYVPVTATAEGATFELIAPSLADFGQSPLGAAAPGIPVTLKNVGNAPAKVSVTAPVDPQYSFTWTGGPDAAEVAPGAVFTGLAAQFTATSNKETNSAGLIEVDGPVCGASATSIAVKGQGLGGTSGFSPGSFDLGKVGCNTTGAPQLLTLFNTGNLVYTWSAVLKDGKSFSIEPKAGAVAPGGTAQITITPKPMGMTTNLADGAFSDTLTVTTNIAGDTPKEIAIKETAAGAILKWNATPLDFGTIPAFTESAGKFITITNEGNAPATVKIGGGDQFTSTGGTVPGNGGTLISTVKYKATNLGVQKGNFQIVTDDPICQPLPAGVAGTGAGKGVAQTLTVGGPPKRNNHQGQMGCAILKDSGGRVACFGSNEFGQLGAIGASGVNVVPNLSDVVHVSSAGSFACAATKAGDVYCWGGNRSRNGNRTGNLGTGAVDQSADPLKVEGLSGITQVGAGHNMACALSNTGTVSCWGDNRRGNLGNGNGGQHLNPTPTDVPGLSNITKITVNGGGGCAMNNAGQAWCWGKMERGNLGSGICCSGDRYTPQQVALGGISDIMAMTGTARSGPRCALANGGIAYCWGHRAWGQIGTGSSCCTGSSYPSPVNVSGISGATAIAGTYNGGCVLMPDATVRCWGRNTYGQVGVGDTGVRYSPVQVANLNDATAIAAGGRAACAIVTGGSIKCWGQYGSGSSLTPTAIKNF